MSCFSHNRTSRFFIFAAMLLMLSGCARPDKSPFFIRMTDFSGSESEDFEVKIETDYPPGGNGTSEFPPRPAGPVALSVEQAVMGALANNRDLKVRRLNPVIQGTFEQIERGVFDPEIFARFEYQEEKATETARSTGTRFQVDGSDSVFTGGIRQKLPTGTTVEASIDQDRSISNRTPEQQAARVGLSITQSILRGFGPTVNLASARQAHLGTMASEFELRGFVEALLSDTEIAYWNYVLAREEIAIFKNSLNLAIQQRDETEQRIEVGILPEIEAAPARAEVAMREQDLIDAESNLEKARLSLVRLVNPNMDGAFDIEIRATSDPRIEPVAITDISDRLLLAEKQRPDLKQAQILLAQNRLQTLITRNGLLPRLDFFIALGKTGYSDSFSDSFREIDGTTGDLSVGMSLSHYLGNRAARARDRAAAAGRRQARESIMNLTQIVRLDVRLAVNEAERARKQISASEITRALAEKTLEAEKERFDVGASTSLLVARAQRDFLAAQIDEIRAVVEYRIALTRLYLAEGSLLERRGIRLYILSD